MLSNLPVSPAEIAIYGHYIMLLQLLEIGIPYDSIYEMNETEINYILAAHAAIIEKRNQQ